jgi:hypothetical protein
MNINSLTEAFTFAIVTGTETRRLGNNGLEAWNNIRTFASEKLSHITLPPGAKWAPHLNKDLYNKFHDEFGMRGDSTDPKSDNWERYHFFLQLVRIPLNKSISLETVLQIGFNIGQYWYHKTESVYDSCRVFFEENRMNCMSYYLN